MQIISKSKILVEVNQQFGTTYKHIFQSYLIHFETSTHPLTPWTGHIECDPSDLIFVDPRDLK